MTADDARRQLEKIVDEFGLQVVCDMLGGICGDKATHLRKVWKDGRAAKAWDEAGRAFHATEVRVRDFDIIQSKTRARRTVL